MSRINVGINPKALTDEHLLAEHREIKRICDLYTKRIQAGINPITKGAPTKQTLGTGHMLFFLDKGQYTWRRYNSIYIECLNRGFQVTSFETSWRIYAKKPHWNNYKETSEDKAMLLERISQRINESPKPHWHYCGKIVTKQEACNILESLC